MFYVKSASTLTRSGLEVHFRRGLLSTHRLRSTVTSTSPSPARTGKEDRGHRGAAEEETENPAADEVLVDFEKTQEVYRSKASLELLRSLVVFKLCSYDFLVDKNKEIMDLGKKVLGQKAFDQFMKMTFYGQFVAGEDQKEIRPLIQKNLAFGVGSVLDYSVEEDISEVEVGQIESSVCLHACTRVGGGVTAPFLLRANRDSMKGGTKAFTCTNSEEAKCDRHMETFIKCIKASGWSSTDGFSAIKMTALGRPQFLLNFSEVLVKWQNFYAFLAAQQGKDATLKKKLDLTQIAFICEVDMLGCFINTFLPSHRCIDVLDWNSLIDERTKTAHLLVVPNVELGELEPLLKRFTQEEEEQMRRIFQRMEILGMHAQENGVRLMVDAEQTYFQPAISRLTLEMQRIFNTTKPIIFNTYQCYLKDAYENITRDVQLSKREGWCFAAKLVRGAYMYQERERAEEMGYEDPINADYESTNRMYHRCLDYVLDEIALNRKANVMVASHNEDTIKHTLKRMNELRVLPKENKVYFGQLLGMCDQISFPLGQAGFPVFKYVPYGPVSEVMPYLSRRAQENRGFMKGAQRERELLWKELKRRLASGELLYQPVY
uniref:Proline dehydrogenase n=1 Tax=Gouania willdenowi TaxID=441366 RepID=A0A8C5GR11_GOUWI